MVVVTFLVTKYLIKVPPGRKRTLCSFLLGMSILLAVCLCIMCPWRRKWVSDPQELELKTDGNLYVGAGN